MSVKFRIMFLYPSSELGGAEMLFYRHYVALRGKNCKSGFIITSENEIYHQLVLVPDDLVHIDNIAEVLRVEELFIITPPPVCFNMDLLRKIAGSKLVVWSIHPGLLLLDNQDNFLCVNKFMYRKLINKLHYNNALWFLDKSTFTPLQKQLELKFNPKIKQLLIDSVNLGSELNTSRISIAFIQRGVKPKVVQALRVIRELRTLLSRTKQTIDIHVVGEGNAINLYHEVLDDFEFINVKYHGTLMNDDLLKLLRAKVDITFSMGLSALESAIMGNFSIILDLVVTDESQDEIRFDTIYDVQDYSLGQFYDKSANCRKKHSINDILDIIFDENKLYKAKVKSTKFATDNFTFNKMNIETFVSDVLKTDFKITTSSGKKLSNRTLQSRMISYIKRQ